MPVASLKNLALFLAPALALGLYGLGPLLGLNEAASMTAAVTLLCALWWMSEALPLPATALLPLALFPLFDVLSPNDVAQAYGHPLILLFMGGFLLSKAMAVSGAHRQIALRLIHYLGSSQRRLVMAFLFSSAALSMWVSNTATALMLLPVAIAAGSPLGSQLERSPLTPALLLAVAYGASIGGLATPIGSPPNLIFLQNLEELSGESLSFLQWMSLGLPLCLVLLPFAAWYLGHTLSPRPMKSAEKLPTLEGWQGDQLRVLLIFGLTALAWMTRQEPFGGWSSWLGLPQANDASVALLAALLLFILPGKQEPNSRSPARLLNWEQAQDIPWGMLVLFGGGITIAKAFSASGLSEAMAQGMSLWLQLPILLLLILIAFAVSFLTEINSNTATAVILLPVLGAAAVSANLPPALLLLPATFAASCAFMLPVATPPNAIVYGSGALPAQTMLRKGLMMNLVSALVIGVYCYLRLPH